MYSAHKPIGEDFRNSEVDAKFVVLLLNQVDPALLSEFTYGGRPTGVAPIHMVCSGRDHEEERCMILRELIRLAASPSIKVKESGATALHRAAGTGASKILQILIEAGAHVNVQNAKWAPHLWMQPVEAADRHSRPKCFHRLTARFLKTNRRFGPIHFSTFQNLVM